ncbi:MAG: metalloregulator ArsR/SmtB family transcription factor [Nitrococcus mobilis]|nr:metalloregulator ArsR/SmtB family transcription factor [Nitrococcus mobilis]
MKAAHQESTAPQILPEALFRALSDSTRLRAVVLLAREGELCVCELTIALRVSQPKMSRHLAVLRETRLVDVRRDGVWSHYRLAGGLPQWAREALRTVADGCYRQAPFARDVERLHRMPDRPGGRCST